VQAFQFALKLVLFIVPAIWLLLAVGPQVREQAVRPVEYTRFTQDTGVDFSLDTRFALTEPVTVGIDGAPPVRLPPGEYTAAAGARWDFPAGAAVPRIDGAAVPGSATWQRPLLDTGGSGHPLLGTWTVLVATALGTMGLPHVLVRFHTSPDGRSARRTAAITVALLGTFYLFPGVYGLLGAVLLPELYLSGATDTVVVALPSRVDPGPLGNLFTALLTAGAFAAFLATSLGLLLAVSGAVAHDLIPATLRRLRLTALAAAAVVVLLALPAARIDVGALVTSAFAVAASTFCPLLVLGIWWRRLTVQGALVGMAVGLVSSAGVMAAGLVAGLEPGVPALLLAQPALWSVPLAFATMVVVSLRGEPPPGATSAMLRLHLDETRVPSSR
jgi:Na+(H+)/acetate symporter ActP